MAMCVSFSLARSCSIYILGVTYNALSTSLRANRSSSKHFGAIQLKSVRARCNLLCLCILLAYDVEIDM